MELSCIYETPLIDEGDTVVEVSENSTNDLKIIDGAELIWMRLEVHPRLGAFLIWITCACSYKYLIRNLSLTMYTCELAC